MNKLVLVLLLSVSSGLAFAQDHAGHGGHQAAPAESPSTAQYKAQMDRMHKAMMGIDYTGDADIDFARGMIPHHQAAIDMARTVLEHGRDPEIRKLAEEIVAAQEAEIAQLEAWLKAHED
ncbi:CopM family metallochaperone [Limoniibacter endophyticus]|uniref:DUF305 domain-containing protein n=1 Tax=Limoniibacter endophyticus TaxID=1565040 RepID=A0A8J3DGR1_9HYPH|nr:DUF305 domain-containing protein [Limoniibacter endophyticus]GHC65718.1 hypothetical protein GCM10010136_08640 [Limoniibacter endophyticus]